MRATILAILTVSAMAACSSGTQPLHDMQGSGGGPDDFSVIPVAPLEFPESKVLPQPTPGGSNLTDPTPKADAIAALGGRASTQLAGGIPARDGALIARASRHGVTANIRQQLATEDAAVRTAARRFSFFGLFGGGSYFSAYANQALNAYAELARFRAAGVATPTAPPAP